MVFLVPFPSFCGRARKRFGRMLLNLRECEFNWNRWIAFETSKFFIFTGFGFMVLTNIGLSMLGGNSLRNWLWLPEFGRKLNWFLRYFCGDHQKLMPSIRILAQNHPKISCKYPKITVLTMRDQCHEIDDEQHFPMCKSIWQYIQSN